MTDLALQPSMTMQMSPLMLHAPSIETKAKPEAARLQAQQGQAVSSQQQKDTFMGVDRAFASRYFKPLAAGIAMVGVASVVVAAACPPALVAFAAAPIVAQVCFVGLTFGLGYWVGTHKLDVIFGAVGAILGFGVGVAAVATCGPVLGLFVICAATAAGFGVGYIATSAAAWVGDNIELIKNLQPLIIVCVLAYAALNLQGALSAKT